jgi:NADH-quinone oxidoreductase subunit M
MVAIISITLLLPALTALVLLLMPSRNDHAIRLTALFGTLVTLGFSLGILFAFEKGEAGFQLVESHEWVASLGISYKVGVDGISIFMLLLTAIVLPISVLCSWRSVTRRVLEFHVSLLLLEVGMIGVFVALDLVLFYVFWEIMLVPMVLIIGVWGSGDRIRAAVKFFLYTVAGSLLMFFAIVYLYVHVSQHGAPTFDIAALRDALRDAPLGAAPQMLLFLAFALSFAIKVPLFPLHTWLPDAHTEAPTAGSVVLAAVLLKMGTYGFIRFAIPFFPEAAAAATPWISALAVIGIIFGACMCLVQEDMKRLIAYSSVSHLGFVMLGIFALNSIAVTGGVLQMVNHGLSTGALFLLVGAIYERRHSRRIADYGGLATTVPRFSIIFFIATLSAIGLPFLNGFVGEYLILQGTFQEHKGYAVWAATGVILGAVYMLVLCRRLLLGEPPRESPGHQGLSDLTGRELSFLIPLVLLMVAIGLFSPWFTERITPSVESWMSLQR